MVTINTIGVSKEIDGESGAQLTDELTFLSGQYAGTCYAADGYETIRTQEPQKALRRAENTAQNGHHSVFQHSMVTMEIQCPKIILKQQIEALYPEKFSEREADKLAYENARYMLSVFCPTSMVYSLPFRNIFYVMDWAEQMRDQLNGQADAFSKRLAEELSGLVKSLDVVIGGKRIFHDNKNEYFRFMPVQATGQLDDDNVEYFGDVYTAKFLASFAQVAQEQRHRTLRVKINFAGDKPGEYGYYVPELLQEQSLQEEWLQDIAGVAEQFPQGMLVSVTEQGLFEDFALKCKERMCGRAQLEIMRLTEELVARFAKNKQNLSSANRRRLEDLLEDDKPCARCGYRDFQCVEGCKWGKAGALLRHI